jgi:hypothetical protein
MPAVFYNKIKVEFGADGSYLGQQSEKRVELDETETKRRGL